MGGKMLLCSLWKKSSLLFTYKNYSGSKVYSRIFFNYIHFTVYPTMFIL